MGAGHNLAAGYYYIGVSNYNYDPYDTNGDLMFQSTPYDPLYGPLTTAPLGSWSGYPFEAGTYWINFQRITSDGEVIDDNPVGEVPEPGTLLLFASGLAGLARVARKRFAT